VIPAKQTLAILYFLVTQMLLKQLLSFHSINCLQPNLGHCLHVFQPVLSPRRHAWTAAAVWPFARRTAKGKKQLLKPKTVRA